MSSTSSDLQNALSQRKARLAQMRAKSKSKTPEESNKRVKLNTDDNVKVPRDITPDVISNDENDKIAKFDNSIVRPIVTLEDKAKKSEAEALEKYAKLAKDISTGLLPDLKSNEVKHEVDLDDYDITKINTREIPREELVVEFEEQLGDDLHYLKHLTDEAIKNHVRDKLLNLQVKVKKEEESVDE